MTTPLQVNTSALLADGRVLVSRGSNSELYNPATGSWTTAASPAFGIYRDSATTLADGRVLVVGTSTVVPGGIPRSQFYDPADNTWTLGPDLPISIVTSMAGRFADGRVIVAGSTTQDWFAPSAAAEYDPTTNSWTTLAAPPAVGEWAPSGGDARMLPNGDFVTSLGLKGPSVYNRDTNTWRELPLPSTYYAHGSSIALLPSGHIMVVGGVNYDFTGARPTGGTYEVDPVSGVWTEDAPLPRDYSWTTGYFFDGSSFAELGNGSILATGGQTDSDLDYVYTPATGTWTAVPGRNAHAVGTLYDHDTVGWLVTLTDGSVLAAGGFTGTVVSVDSHVSRPGDLTDEAVIFTP
jgi:hypothetical protein